MEIKIKKVQSADKEILWSLSKKTFIDTYYHLNEPEHIDAYIEQHFNPSQVEKDLADDNNIFYMAWQKQTAVGYFKMRWNTPSALADFKVLEIERIYVNKAFQGQKIGKALMQQALEVAQKSGGEYVWLGVWNENHNALAFYKKQGFEVFGTQVFMMGADNQEDYLMKKRI